MQNKCTKTTAASLSETSSQLHELPLTSVVIVNWNTCESLRTCLTSLFRHTKSIVLEVIVVDNASTDGSIAMLNARFPGVHVIANTSNAGFAKACNQGMQAAQGQLFLILNSDTFVCDDVIGRMASYLISRMDIDMAGCQLRYPDGRIQHSAFRSLSMWRSLFEDLWLYKFVPVAQREHLLLGLYWDSSTEKEVDWLAGAFIMVRRQVVEELGGLDEDFFMYGEDGEWGMRLRRAGRKVMFTPLGIVYHVGSVSSDQVWTEEDRLRRCHLGGLQAYSKINGPGFGFMYRLIRLFGASVRFAVYSVLMTLKDDTYYGIQRRLYGWQVGIYSRTVMPRSSSWFLGSSGSKVE